MVMLTTTQAPQLNQQVKAIYATVEGRQVKVLDVRNVCDTDPAQSFLVADVQVNNNCLPFSVSLEKLQNIYALVEQVMQ